MGFIEAIKTCFSKYIVFSGRAGRAEYWWFYLFTVLVSLIPLIGGIASLVLIIPTLAVTWRRLHDIGRSGWWYLGFLGVAALASGVGFLVMQSVNEAAGGVVIAIGVIGVLIWSIVWLASRGEDGPNRFGDDPRGSVDADVFA